MKKNEAVIHPVVSSAFAENCYVVYLRDSKECVVIDPGFNPEYISSYLLSHGLELVAILITHGHADHFAGVPFLKREFPGCRVYVGEHDAYKLTDPEGNLSAPFDINIKIQPADRILKDGDSVDLCGMSFSVMRIPGHSAGHVAYKLTFEDDAVVFVGDIIFAGGIGRYDFFDGNKLDLLGGIRSKLYTLPDSSILYPGHGPETTVGREKRTNPYCSE